MARKQENRQSSRTSGTRRLVSINVSKVVKGGRRFALTALVVVATARVSKWGIGADVPGSSHRH